MPLYQYECLKCKHQEEKFASIARRMARMKCSKCGSVMNKLIVGSNVEVFKPMVYEHICETPIFIRTRNHLKEECKKHGVIAARIM